MTYEDLRQAALRMGNFHPDTRGGLLTLVEMVRKAQGLEACGILARDFAAYIEQSGLPTPVKDSP